MPEEIILDPDSLSEEAREPFIGEVVWAKYPCDCEVCSRGQFGQDQLHIQIQPIDGVYSATQHEWYRPTKTARSAYGMLVKALAKLGMKKIKPSDLVGKVFEWHYTEYETPGGDKKYVWIPSRLLSDAEVSTLKKAMERGTL